MYIGIPKNVDFVKKMLISAKITECLAIYIYSKAFQCKVYVLKRFNVRYICDFFNYSLHILESEGRGDVKWVAFWTQDVN